MCIVVDPPAFLPMFKTEHRDHKKFVKVKEWVEKKDGKFVIGGTKYMKELKKIDNVIIRHLTELERKGKIKKCDLQSVDKEIAEVKRIVPSTSFNDEHLAALVRHTGCHLICLVDKRAHKYLTSRETYGSTAKLPKLHTGSKRHDTDLLIERNIAPCCRVKSGAS
jgi:hypothetical protein